MCLAVTIGLMAAAAAVASAHTPDSALNPTLEARCGLKVMLVLDESNSIYTFDAVDTVREAATTFVEALEGTGSPLAITAFHSIARHGVPIPAGYQEVDPGNVETFTNWIDNVGGGGYDPPATVTTGSPGFPPFIPPTPANGTTNWEDGFAQVDRTHGGPPDLVVFVTDGDPNTVNDPNAPGGRRFISNNEQGFQTAVGPAVTAANIVKRRSRIFGIGVGPDVTGPGHPMSAERLRRVTGTQAGNNPITDDYTLVKDFGDLRTTLAHIVARLCGSSLTITKYVDDRDGAGWNPAGGWAFTATLDPTPGHTWLEPAAGQAHSATASTAQEGEHVGRAAFHWRLHKDQTTAELGVTKEAVKPGYRFVWAQCQTHRANGTSTEEGSGSGIPGATLGVEDYHSCEVYNVRRVGHLTIVKRLVPDNDPGRFDLLVNGAPPNPGSTDVGNAGTTGRVPVGLGTHTVSERAAGATMLDGYSTSTRCVDRRTGTQVAAGVGTVTDPVSVPVKRETDDIVCTITNTSATHGNLTIIKHLLPPTDPGRFALLLNGQRTAINVGDGGSTGPMFLPFGPYTVSEEAFAPQGLALSLYTISTTCDQNGQTVASGVGTPEAPVAVTLNSTSLDVVCMITNERNPSNPASGFMTLRLRVEPSDDPGRFDLHIDGKTYAPAVGDGGSTARTRFNLGTHEVSLSVTASQHGVVSLHSYSISTRCRTPRGATVHATGAEPVTTPLKTAGQHVDCEILLVRKELPTDPGPGETAPGGGGEAAAAPRLFVSKQMPAHAGVGHRVPITITVVNTGHATAHRVGLHETREHGGRIVQVTQHGSIQRDGTAVWNLGSLGPGERRTVHATMLVTRTGSLRDIAVAHASNAHPAFDTAGVLARAAAHRGKPSVTG